MSGFKTVGVVLFCFCLVEADVVVETKSGKVAGVEVSSILKDEKYYSFFSIPYAEPPVDRLRFMPPKPHPGWTDTWQAKKERKPCAHFNLPMRSIKRYGFAGEEDCLYLSIHTPKLPSEGNPSLPVIVFLYNEQFKIAYNASKEYDPDFFMKEDVIIVTLQHRLGSLGFLSFEDDLLPGNNGLRDVILALKWIQTNVESFGGDPNRVTLMGNDGGAVMVDLLLHSPKAKGLFQRAILQSGTVWHSAYICDNPRERAIQFTKEVEEHATSSSFLIKRLTYLDASLLTECEERAVEADESRKIQKGIIPFGPVIEHNHPDAIITQYPESKPVIELDIPVMIGYNSREGMAHSHRFIEKPNYLTFANRDFVFMFPYRTNYTFVMDSKKHAEAVTEIKNFYFKNGNVKISKLGEYLTYAGDIHVFYAVDYAVRNYVKNSNNKVYYYSFDYSGDFNINKKYLLKEAGTFDGTWGASTGDELCYLFVCKSLKKSYQEALQDEDSEEIKVIKNMVRLWSNFAKSGNPTPPGEDVEWKPATEENKECLVISDELTLKTRLHDDRVSFWDEFIERHRAIAVDGKIEDAIDPKDEL